MRKQMAGLAFGLAVFGIFLLATLPASLVIPLMVPTAAQQHLQLGEFSGSVWNGSTDSVHAFRFDLGAAHWELSPLALILLRVDGIFEFRRSGFAANGIVSYNSGDDLLLENVRGELLLSELAAVDLMLPGVTGVLKFDIEYLDLVNRLPSKVSGNVTVTDLRLAWIPGLDLGIYEATLDNDDRTVRAVIRDIGGPLKINLVMLLTPEIDHYSYSLQGAIQPKANTEMLLAPALQWLGKPDSLGRYAVNHSGTIRP
ncbi:MAG: type II secretion system protein N [Gammaproteobacteria bacterium]